MSTPTLLSIGRTLAGAPFGLPPQVATETQAIIGIRGSGKTYTAKVLVEELLERGQQVVILDPTDAWWGLKSSADGSRPGYGVAVLGGPHGDLPLTAESGKAVADFAVEHRTSLICSLRHFRKGAMRQFVTDLLEQFYHRKGEPQHRTPVTIIIDECSQFIPQRVDAKSARMVGAVQDCVRLGRSSGLGMVLIDQRPASVNKDALAMAEVLIAHRVAGVHDRKALDEWTHQHDSDDHRGQFLAVLAALPKGEAWVWSPLLEVFERVRVRALRTFDSSATPEMGMAVAKVPKVARVDLRALGELMATSAVPTGGDGDVAKLRTRLADLERQLAAKPAAPPAPVVDEARERMAARAAADISRALTPILAAVRELAPGLPNTEAVQAAAAALGAALANGRATSSHGTAPARTPPHAQPTSAAKASSSPNPAPAPGGRPNAAEQRLLDALATYEGFGQAIVERAGAAAIARYKEGGYFNTTVRRAIDTGWVSVPTPGTLALTKAGRAYAAGQKFKTVRGWHAAWMDRCTPAQRRILTALVDHHPVKLTRQQLAAASGYGIGGYFNTALKGLITVGAAEDRGGVVGVSALLYPEGLTH